MPLVPKHPEAAESTRTPSLPWSDHVPFVPQPTGETKSAPPLVPQLLPKYSESPPGQNGCSQEFVRFGDPFQESWEISSGIDELY